MTMTGQTLATILVRVLGLSLVVTGALGVCDILLIYGSMPGAASSGGWSTYPPAAASPASTSVMEGFLQDTYYVVSGTTSGFTSVGARIVLGFALIFTGAPLGRILSPRETESSANEPTQHH